MQGMMMSAFALLAFAAATTLPGGSAEIYGPPAPAVRSTAGYGPSVAREVQELRRDIGDARDAGELSRREAKELRRDASDINMLEDRFSQGGLSDSERKELQNRTEVLRAITRAKSAGLMK